jgi:RNA polymerase sigma-70 factor, ECF subfamily
MEEAYWSNQLENQWVDRARAGDLPAFNQLVLAYQDAAFRVAYDMVRDDACAEDIVQMVFITAYRRIGSFRTINFRAWLLKMVRNTSIDELRRRKRHPSLALEPQHTDDQAANVSKWTIDAGQSPEETLIQKEDWEWIDHCLQRLPEPLRAVVILIDMERLSYSETAHILGIPLGTVKSRIGRARARMRALLREVPLVAEREQEIPGMRKEALTSSPETDLWNFRCLPPASLRASRSSPSHREPLTCRIRSVDRRNRRRGRPAR